MNMILHNQTSPEKMAQVSVILGETFAAAAEDFLANQQHWYIYSGRSRFSRPDDMAHAQHDRHPRPNNAEHGEGAIVTARTGITTVTDFRVSEVAVGRQCAPLVAFFEALLLYYPTKLRACQSIGGIANVCFIPLDSHGGVDRCYEFDNGPGDVYIDAAVRHYTGRCARGKDGEMGRRGTVHQALVDDFLASHEYFSRSIPKTTGREEFRDWLALELIATAEMSPDDVVATITRITAQSIVQQYSRFAPLQDIAELFLCGGGARNPNIVNYIRVLQYPNSRVYGVHDERRWDAT